MVPAELCPRAHCITGAFELGVGGRCWSPAWGLRVNRVFGHSPRVTALAHQPAHSPNDCGLPTIAPESVPRLFHPWPLGAYQSACVWCQHQCITTSGHRGRCGCRHHFGSSSMAFTRPQTNARLPTGSVYHRFSQGCGVEYLWLNDFSNWSEF